MFLGRMVGPVAIISLVMFGMFSLLSWSIPHVLCETYSKELSGSTVGYMNVCTTRMAITAVSILRKYFGSYFGQYRRVGSLCFQGIFVRTFCTPLVTALAYGMALNNYIVLAVSAIGSFLVNVICASASVRYTKDRIMKWRWISLFLLAGQVNTVYLFVMPRLLTLKSSDALGGMGLTLIRIVIHPGIWATVLFFFRSVQRHIGHVDNLKQVCFLVWPILYSALYGRFLLLQLEDVGSVIVMNFLFACISISSQLHARGPDSFWLGLLYGRKARDAMETSMDVDEQALAMNFSIASMELASILSASALLSFGAIAPVLGVAPNHRSIWFNAFAQLGTSTIFFALEFVIGKKFHSFAWEKVYPKSVLAFLGYILPVLIIGGSRLCVELLLLFCPRYYDSTGILLEQCDKDTLFEYINATSFLTRPATESIQGPWIEL
eukprot:jgi/Picre1/30150/NNA_005519.t1